jgi:DNA-binding transcriptional regulator PaaX
MGLDTLARGQKEEGFTLAVFSFTKDKETERAVVRETLKNCGFKRLAQNTYINGRIDTQNLMRSMKDHGVDKNIYQFQCPDIDDPDLIKKILALFDVEARMNQLNRFYTQMVDFLDEEGLSEIELGRRLLYFGAIYWSVCEVGEPPIPLKHLPKDYPMPKIKAYYHDFVQKNKEKLIQYYISVNT